MTTLTSLGRYLKLLRMNHNETQIKMAERLRMATSQLSSFEHGTRHMPETMLFKIKREYDLSETEYKELTDSWFRSRAYVKIRVSNLTANRKDLVFLLAKKIYTLTDDECSSLLEILNR